MHSSLDAHRFAPGRAARVSTALLAVATVPLTAGAVGLLEPTAALIAGGALAAAGFTSAFTSWDRRRRQRATADRLLLDRRELPVELAWRERELVSSRERRRVARSLRGLVRSLQRQVVMTAQVVNRPAARPQVSKFLALAERLERDEAPVAARGMLVLRRLLTNACSPLFDRTRADELPEQLDRALSALEPRH